MIGFLLFEQFHGKKDIGSSRIRGHQLIKHWKGTEPFRIGRKYDMMVFQKAYWCEYAEAFEGIKVLDVCDPDFLHWGYPFKRMLNAVDGVTTSTEALAETIAGFTDKPVAFIQDRFDFDVLPKNPKVHKKRDSKIAVWYGYSQNYPLLNSTIIPLVKEGFEKLIVISDKKYPFVLPAGTEGKIDLVNYPFTSETYIKDILEGDLVINPKFTGAHWKYKSDNKTSLSWLLGMPVAHDGEELKKLKKYEDRKKESDEKFKYARANYNVLDSVKELQEFCEILKKERDGVGENKD